MAAVGVHQALSPVLDVVRDYRWGRVEETMGEDPYLVSQLGTAYVRGLEDNGIIATLKHFAGYSASKAARNHAPVSMGPRELADYILPPFEYAVRAGRVGSVMNSYADVDGLPVASDPVLLTEAQPPWPSAAARRGDLGHRAADRAGGGVGPALRTGRISGPGSSNRPSLLPWRGGRGRASRSPIRARQSLGQAAGRGPPSCRRPAVYIPSACPRT
jgi:Glycosyl hydrolase family 3 N terminal domain